MSVRLAPVAAAVVLAGCNADSTPATPQLTAEELLDPASCEGCHPDQYRDWSGSMHAYAAEDPVFLAMNARGQEETDGELGDFCVSCHAPMAVRMGLTTDGTDLADVEPHLRGVTCVFCHTVEAVEGEHNNPLRLADDGAMRGPFDDPVAGAAHPTAYSELLDRTHIRSADLCGSCHDIVTPAGVHLERTFAEWKDSLFSEDKDGRRLTCARCHMPGSNGLAAQVDGAFERRVASHAMPGVDVALTDFPERETQRALVQADLDYVVIPQLCVDPIGAGTSVTVTLENIGAGHSWPSGAAQDRRAWVGLRAEFEGRVLFESGALADDEAVVDAARDDDDLWQLRDWLKGEDGEDVHMFWEAASVESDLLPTATTRCQSDPRWIDTHRQRRYLIPGPPPTRIELSLHIRPLGLDVVRDLVASEDLDPGSLDKIDTFTLAGGSIVWTPELGQRCIPEQFAAPDICP